MADKVVKLGCNSVVRRYVTAAATAPAIPKCDFTPKQYTGPSYQKTEQVKSQHMPPAIFNIYKKPLLLHQGRMQWLYDHEGSRYLDLFGGIVTVSVGHCHPKVVGALQDQINTLWHCTNIYRHPKIYEYVEQLVAKFPGDLKVVYLVNSGTEANDLATLLAKAYTGNLDVVSLQSSYHGYSSALMGLTATQSYRMKLPVPPGFYHTMLPDPYRGIWGGCRDSHSQVAGACSCPGDCVTSDKYVHQLNEVIEEEELQKNCKETGKYFIEQLMQLQKIHPVIGDVRGKGLMLGFEYVVPGTKEPLDVADVNAIHEDMKDMGVLIGRGGRWSNVMRIKPPMCINKEDVDFAVSVIDKAIKNYTNNKK